MTTTDTPTILTADRLDMDLLRLLATRYIVVVERKGDRIIYELHDK